ncbi:MAG TPA: AraC family transcriptional regulator ligand-binding domain-containing protein [Nevskiaceae bacterium]|nr:AraC family transcriptional regulator ligand-binding domain-containing protein [Nevskiaceae bacterium]
MSAQLPVAPRSRGARHPVPFITLTNWVRAAARCDVDIEAIFKALQIPMDLMHLETAMVDGERLMALMEACTAASHDRHFPFVLGDTFAFDYLPDIGTFIDTAPTLRAAARAFEWLPRLIAPAMELHVVETPPTARIVLVDRFNLDSPHLIESWVASIVKFGRNLLSHQADFTRLCFRYSAPPWAPRYGAYFGVPIVFGAPHYALEFPAALLDQTRHGALGALHEQARLRIQQRLREAGTAGDVVSVLERELEHQPALLRPGAQGGGMAAAAAALKLHPRTLQRRLAEHGEHYADVLARVRYRLALTALRDPSATVEAVSQRLGFADRRSFARAFVQWSGMTPGAYRGGQRSLRPPADRSA